MAKSGSDYGGSVSNEQLQAEIFTLKSAIAQMVQANSIENVIEHGMTNLAAMLEPLRTLRPVRTRLNDEETAVLSCIHATLERPDYATIETGPLDGFGKPLKGKNEGKGS